MKKILLILAIVLLGIKISYTQQGVREKVKEVTITPKMLFNGGEYVIINGTLGRVSRIKSIEIRYNFNTVAYTVTPGTQIYLYSNTGDGISEPIVAIVDELFQKTIPYIAYSDNPNSNFAYNNSISVVIPEEKFTLGNSEVDIRIVYELIQ